MIRNHGIRTESQSFGFQDLLHFFKQVAESLLTQEVEWLSGWVDQHGPNQWDIEKAEPATCQLLRHSIHQAHGWLCLLFVHLEVASAQLRDLRLWLPKEHHVERSGLLSLLHLDTLPNWISGHWRRRAHLCPNALFEKVCHCHWQRKFRSVDHGSHFLHRANVVMKVVAGFGPIRLQGLLDQNLCLQKNVDGLVDLELLNNLRNDTRSPAPLSKICDHFCIGALHHPAKVALTRMLTHFESENSLVKLNPDFVL
jgi:hypothetical protein